MTIIGVAGAIGSGKSFTQLKHGLKYVEERQKQLVTNFPIDVKALHKYASLPKEHQSFLGYFRYNCKMVVYSFRYYLNVVLPIVFKKPKKPKFKSQFPWIKRLCECGGIVQIPSPDKIEALLIPESVVLLDEAGILLNSREFAKTSKQLLADLAQSRKDGCDLIWCAQFDEQVDRQLRLLTQFWIYCESISMFDKKMRRPKLYYKRIFWFRCSDFQEWLRNPRARGNHIKTRLVYSTLYEGGFLTPADRQVFKIYDSFKRLDKKFDGALIETYWQCRLPKNYYYELTFYHPELDPVHKKYQPVWGWYRKLKKSEEIVINKNSVQSLNKTKTELISLALTVARRKNIKPPYFKSMDDNSIRQFIENNK